VAGAGIVSYENLGLVKTLNPTELSQLIGIYPDDRSIVIITSGRNLFRDPWYSAERLIIVLKQGG